LAELKTTKRKFKMPIRPKLPPTLAESKAADPDPAVWRFTNDTHTAIANAATGYCLEWDSVRNCLVTDHGYARDAYRAAGSPRPLDPLPPEPLVSYIPRRHIIDDNAGARLRSAGEDRRNEA
jgi:hypothetical protein